MTYNKNLILGIILTLLTIFTIYSCFMAFGARQKEPERAKLVLGYPMDPSAPPRVYSGI